MLKPTGAKLLVIAALLALVAAVAAGFAIDAKAYALHLLAELVGVLTSILVAVFIVDVLVERERGRRWDLVADETINSLRFAILRAGLSVYLMLPIPRPTTADPYTMSEVPETGLAGALHNLAEVVRGSQAIDLQVALVALREHLSVVRGAIMPRLLTIGHHDLIASIAALEGTLQLLEHAVWLNHQFDGIPDPNSHIALVIERLANITTLIEHHGDKPA